MRQRVLLVLMFFCTYMVMADDTVLKLYRPFGEAMEQILPLAKNTVSGECFKQSELIVREDAWRCQAAGKVYDPCFVKPVGRQKEAVCPQSPWVADSVRIVVQTPLNTDQNTSLDMSTAYPWAVELTNGERCQAIDANEQFDGMPIRYHCGDKHWLVGHLQRCKSLWSMLEKTPNGVETIQVRRAWF